MRYEYTGDHPVNLTTLHKSVKKGDVLTVDEPIVHPDFKEVKTKANRQKEA